MMMRSILIGISIAGAALPACAQEVGTDAGAVRGTVAGGVEAFRGIPFAAPPVGALRWRAPQPVTPWRGVRDASRYGHDCAQLPFPSDAAPLGTAPSEDCLVLNVWRPAGVKGPLPVLFWIYGGGFVNGGSSPAVYDGSALARRGLIVVSANYRLGRFGFFVHPALAAAQEAPVGNWGLMDQHAALDWVKRNIARFGGDPAKVTIMGESAGGMSVLDLLGAPAIRGRFRAAIVMSGGGRSGGVMQTPTREEAEKAGVAFARSAGITGVDAAALARLRALSTEQVIGGINLATLFAPPAGERSWTGPWRDGITITGTSEEVFARGGFAPVPVMVGATSADIGPLPVRDKDGLFAIFGPRSAAARAAYDPDGSRPLAALSAAVGADRLMIEPARYIAGNVRAAGQPAFHYRFAYVASAAGQPQGAGAGHASDIPYFLDTVRTKYGAATEARDERMGQAIGDYVAQFVRTGSPAAPGRPAWPPFDGRSVMTFGPDGTAANGPDDRAALLDLHEPGAGR